MRRFSQKPKKNLAKKPKKQAAAKPTPEPEHQITTTEIHNQEEPNSLAILLAERVKYTPVGLVIDDAATLEECGKIYEFQSAIRERSSWMLGDTIKHMARRFPETYAQFIHLTGKSYSSLTTIASVCERIPMERRHEALPFSHHTEVAYLPEAIADEILEKSEKEEWNTRDVREAVQIAQGRAPRTEAGKAKAQAQLQETHHPVIEIDAKVEPATDTKPETAHVEIRLTPEHQNQLPTTANQPAQIPQPNEFEESLARFVASIEGFNSATLKPLARKRLLRLLEPVDELIQKLLSESNS